jgi:integrase
MEGDLKDESEEFELFLNRKGLAQYTKDKYLLSYYKIMEIMQEIKQDEIDQSILNAFLDLYPHIIARATMQNYLEFKGRRDLIISKRTGRPIRKEQITISKQDRESLRMALYEKLDMYGLIFDLTDSCALRRQEVLNIKAQDIDLTDGENMFIIIKRGKGNKERKVFVRDEIAILVMHYLENNPIKLSDYLFQSPVNIGYPIANSSWNKAFTQVCKNVLGHHYHPHQLRGTRATEWYDQGIDITRIQQRLGHNDISTTMLYIKPDQRKELERWSKEKD